MREYILTLVIFSSLVIGFSTFLVGLGTPFGKVPQNLTGLSQQSSLYGNVSDIQESLNQSSSSISIGGLNLLTDSLDTTIRLTLFIPVSIGNIITTTASLIGLPPWFTSMLLLCGTVIVIFMVISAITRWRQ